MLKHKVKWCKRCKECTPHFTWKELFPHSTTNVFDRMFFGITTLGASEFMCVKTKKCKVCGKTKRKPV